MFRPLGIAVLLALSLGRAGDLCAAPTAAHVSDAVDAGHYLSILADCAPCHAGPKGEPFAGGRPLATPFGTLLASNLTPDPATGIGAWTDQEFVRAVREGIGRDGQHLYPAMPYAYYTRMTPEEIVSIRRYLATVAPVAHEVQENQLPFPYRIRGLVSVWNSLYFHPGEFAPVASASTAWNRGAYLVEGPGHCGACHTPKTRLGGEDKNRPLAGAELEGWYSPDLRDGQRAGLGGWSRDEIAEYLQSGTNAHAAASGPMGDVIEHSTSLMTDADVAAIATYLVTRTAPAPVTENPRPTNRDTSRRGEALYVEACASCHGADGLGVPRLFPPMKASPVVQSADPVTLIRVVLHGAQNIATDRAPTGPAMPPFGWSLDDAQVAAVLSYVRNSWGNAASAVTAREVTAARKRGRK